MPEERTCSRSMFIVMLVVGILLQSWWLLLAEEICTNGVSNYTTPYWTNTTINVSKMKLTTERIDPDCSPLEKIIAFDRCRITYRRQTFTVYETKTIMVETHNVTCCLGYEMIHDDNTCTLSGCPEGTYGDNCTRICFCPPPNAYGHCDNITGHCTCRPGWHGPNCTEVCAFGYHGKGCSKTCSHCNNTKYCNHVNGTCICFGNKGEKCTEACHPGTYGLECKMHCKCNSSHSNGTCDPATGRCRCLEEWTGRACDNRILDTVAEKQTSGFNSIYIVILALGICFTIIAVGILVYMLIRRKQNRDRRPTDTTQHMNELSLRNTNVSGERATDSDVHTYADIEDQIRGSYIDFNDFKANTTENDASERVSDDQDDSHEQSHYQQLQNTESRVYSQLLKDTPVTDTTYEIPVVSSKTGPISE